MERPLRFAMVTTFYPPYNFGGDGIYVQRLSKGLAERGHRVDVIHCRDSYALLSRGSPVSHRPAHPNIHVHTLGSRVVPALSPILTQQTGRPGLKAHTLRSLLDEQRFDVIHFHNVSLIGGPGVLAYGKALKLYTLHEYWLVCPMHTLVKNNKNACESPECVRCTVSYRRPPQLWRYTGLLERSIAHVDAFLSPSRFTAEMHAERGLDLPTIQLPLFVPPPAADVTTRPHPNAGRPYFLVVGRLEKLKGIQDVIPFFAGHDGPDLLIVGDGAHRGTLESTARGLPRVRFLGRRPYEELGALYHHATALISASLSYETFGLVALEAFSYGTPVVSRRLGAIQELVDVSGGGLLFSTEADIRQAIGAFNQDPALRDRLGARGRSYYEDHGTADRHLDSYLNVVRQRLRAREGVV